ncbi:hypothetical protein Salat_1351400 [Sesamum alatum]|uniref:Uncharacterized protein n=1 Tax=Sesamum alatum TaxID=300844 RepID=A0AAE1YI36_9LAMI|nr:hypothetical protein Salat_1351400 [Sesamum alatum]
MLSRRSPALAFAAISLPPSSSTQPLKPAPFTSLFHHSPLYPPSFSPPTPLKLIPPPSAHGFSPPFPPPLEKGVAATSSPATHRHSKHNDRPKKGCGRDGRRHTLLLPPSLKIHGIEQ